MIKILFVCHGNICRSPMAEFVMKEKLKRLGLEDRFFVASAATTEEEIWNGQGNPVYPPAKKMLAAHGISCAGKRAVLMTRYDYRKYDLIVGMDRENMSDMRRICGGDPDGRLSLLMDYTDTPGSVADPWYTGDFQRTYDDVVRGVDGMIEALAPKARR